MKELYTKLYEVKKQGVKLQRDTKAYNYKYATLDQIQTKLGPILEAQKLIVVHSIVNNTVKTQIFDIENDLSISSEIQMAEGTKPQDKGSEITYYRRYNLLSLLDLEVVDDDGKKAQDSNNAQTKLDAMDYVNRIKEETDINHLLTIYKEFKAQNPSDKQLKWIEKECKTRKETLLNNQ